MNAQVHNIGDGPSSATTLRYYRSADSTITASDTEIGTDAVIALRGNILDILDMNPTAPDTPGTYYYGVRVDSVSNESNTTNNCSTAVQVTVIAPPDLIVETPEVLYSSVTLVLGQSFRGTVIVRNQGGTLPSNRYYVTKAHHFLSTDSTITTSDTLLGTKSPSSSGEGRTSWMYLTAPAAGTYYYGVCVDPVSHESDTTNNCSDSVEVIVHAVDLVVENLTVSDSTLTAGERFRLSFDVRNQGDHIHYGPTTLRYYRSNDAEFDSDDVEVAVQTSTDGIPRAGRGFTSDRIIAHRPFVPNTDGRFSYPYITDGTFYYIVCVDPVSDESDTANNCSSGVAVTATRLTASATCIVGYILTPLDKCAHRIQGKFDVIYGEIDAFNSGLGFIYYDFGRLETITRSISGSGPGIRQTTVHITNWADRNWLVTSILTSAGNERIIELRYWD